MSALGGIPESQRRNRHTAQLDKHRSIESPARSSVDHATLGERLGSAPRLHSRYAGAVVHGTRLDDGHQCTPGCWVLSEGDVGSEFEEVVAHEDEAGRFVTFTSTQGRVERYSLDDPMAQLHLGALGLDWR